MQSLKGNQSNNHYKKPQLSAEAFPALSSAATPTAPPKWITVSKPKDKNKTKHQEPLKQKEPSFHPVADFPTLPISTAKPKAKKQPQPQPPPSQNENKLSSKKEKKKQIPKEYKKENASEYDYVNGYDTEVYSHDYMLNNNSLSNESKVKTVTATVTLNSDKPKKTNFAMKPSDYPPLSMNVSASPSSPMVNGTTPAFASVMRPPAPPASCDGMTFTNSSGETFPAPVHEYIRPPNFENRNRALVAKFSIAFGSMEAMDIFKVVSKEFRDGTITGDEFYRHCENSMGNFMPTLFPELVALLPNIAKQQELVRGKPARALVEVCSACGQLLTPNDTLAHDRAHWPALAP